MCSRRKGYPIGIYLNKHGRGKNDHFDGIQALILVRRELLEGRVSNNGAAVVDERARKTFRKA